MNNERRKQLEEAVAALESVKSIVETIRDEEQDAFDNMPEGLQCGDRGQKMESAIDALDSALDEVGSAIDSINEASE